MTTQQVEDPVHTEIDNQGAQDNQMETQAAMQSTAASLYVGDLQPFVTEKEVYEFFRTVGEVASVRVCRDAVTRRSLCYAYVNFTNYPDGVLAIEQLNNKLLAGKPCRIMWSQRDPSVRSSGNCNVFIKNLDKCINSKSLSEVFKEFGKILSCKVVCPENATTGFGFVHFENEFSAEEAIKGVNGMFFNDRKVFAGLHIPRKSREATLNSQRAVFTNVFVKNLPENFEDENLKDLFSKAGEIASCCLQRDTENKSRCFGFVDFETHEAAQKAVEVFNNTDLQGKQIFVGRAQKKAERQEKLRVEFEQRRQERLQKFQGNNLYIKNLDEEYNDEKLLQEFVQFGTVTSCKVMIDDKNQSRGFGFVCFSTPEEAAKATEEMNGKIIGKKPLYVAIAQRKEQRRAQLQVAYAHAAQVPPQYPMPPQVVGAQMYSPMYYPMQQRNYFQMPRQRWQPQQQPPPPQRTQRQARKPQPQVKPRPNQFKYTSGARNTNSFDAEVDPEQRKRELGEALYFKIHAIEPDLAPKITGMLLDLEFPTASTLLENQSELIRKVQEAVQLLKQNS